MEFALVILAAADASELLEKGSILEVLVVPYVWIPGVMLISIAIGLGKESDPKRGRSKKDVQIEIQARTKMH